VNWRWPVGDKTPSTGRFGSQWAAMLSPGDRSELEAILLRRFARTVGVRDLERIAARDEAMRRLDIALRTLI
jgi:hypothetical protein